MNTIFILGFALALTILFYWSFRVLPKERWQIMGAVPKTKGADGVWRGTNLTWYGFFNANAYLLGTAVLFVLLSSVRVSALGIVCFAVALLAVCMPASRLIARWVEKKKHTFSVAGASFAGIIACPLLVLAMNSGPVESLAKSFLHTERFFDIGMMTAMAAVVIGYAFGEGTGRIACISFGCCYGKPVSALPRFLRKLFSKVNFVFTGKTKKIAYAHGLDGEKVFPVQAITAVIYCSAGMLGIWLFLEGFHADAFFFTVAITQIWRFVSEFLRADHRGGLKISAYQIMSVLSVCYALLLALLISHPHYPKTMIMDGLAILWNPGMILFLQLLWILSFLYTGRSQVTTSVMSFSVKNDRI